MRRSMGLVDASACADIKTRAEDRGLGKGYCDCGIPADMLSGLAYRRGRLSRRYLCLHRGGEGGANPRKFAR